MIISIVTPPKAQLSGPLGSLTPFGFQCRFSTFQELSRPWLQAVDLHSSGHHTKLSKALWDRKYTWKRTTTKLKTLHSQFRIVYNFQLTINVFMSQHCDLAGKNQYLECWGITPMVTSLDPTSSFPIQFLTNVQRKQWPNSLYCCPMSGTWKEAPGSWKCLSPGLITGRLLGSKLVDVTSSLLSLSLYLLNRWINVNTNKTTHAYF